MYQLERKYQDLYQPLADKRRAIIKGEYEPTEQESEFKSDDEDESESAEKIKNALDFKKSLPKYEDDVKGVPDFWLTIFRNTDLLSDMIQPHDEPILKKLKDIKIVYEADLSYTVEFHFAENENFTDSVLTKKYFLRCKIDQEEPFAFEGPEIYKCTVSSFKWLSVYLNAYFEIIL